MDLRNRINPEVSIPPKRGINNLRTQVIYALFFMNKKLVFLPKKTYNYFLVRNQLSALAYYIQNKKKYKHSIILNATNKRLAELGNISVSSVKKYKAQLIEAGLCEYNDKKNTLLFRDPNKLTQFIKKGSVLRMSYYQVMANQRDQLKQLKSFSILCNILTQQNAISERLKPIKNYAELRKVARRAKKQVSYNGDRATLGLKKLQEITGKSRITCQRRKKDLNNLNLAKITTHFEKINLSVDKLNELRENFHFLPFDNKTLFCQKEVVRMKVFKNEMNQTYVASQRSCSFRVLGIIA